MLQSNKATKQQSFPRLGGQGAAGTRCPASRGVARDREPRRGRNQWLRQVQGNWML